MALIKRMLKEAPSTVLDAGLTFDLSHGVMQLHVVHRLVDGYPSDPFRGIGVPDKLRKALLIKDPAAKSNRVERRLMLARGEQARKAKSRKANARVSKR
jgi:hypothetical protein